MPRPPETPLAGKDGTRRIGERPTMARKRRRLTLRKLASKAGISTAPHAAAIVDQLQRALTAHWHASLQRQGRTPAGQRCP